MDHSVHRGPARYSIRAADENTVLEAREFAKSRNLAVFVLGGGTNVLVADEGFSGLVLRIGIEGIFWVSDGDRVRIEAGAGEDWDRLVRRSVAHNLAGVECLSGIPGSVGGRRSRTSALMDRRSPAC